jgi:Phosphoadenosine phosphosulfate reductase family
MNVDKPHFGRSQDGAEPRAVHHRSGRDGGCGLLPSARTAAPVFSYEDGDVAAPADPARVCGRLAAVSSFGAESAVLLALIAKITPGVPVLFLDTGKLFGATCAAATGLLPRSGVTDVRTLHPKSEDLAAGDADGVLWLNDSDRCCALRKAVPPASALNGFDAWISGRKRYQGAVRDAHPLFEADDAGRIEINPLAGWSRALGSRLFLRPATYRGTGWLQRDIYRSDA